MITQAQNAVFLALVLVALAVQVYAIVDAARRPAHGYTSERKLTKPIWLAILVAAALLTFALGASLLSLFLTTPAFVYLADVRPRLQPYTRRKGGGSTRSGGGSSSGW